MRQFNPDTLNRNVAPGIADFAKAEIPDLRAGFPQAEHWLSNHYLNTLLGPNYTGRFRQYAINMIFRAQAQFDLYHRARDQTALYLAKSSLHNPAVKHYYQAVNLWESCLLNYQMFIDLYTKAAEEMAFAQDDGSAEQRAHGLANAVKHWGGIIKSQARQDDHNIPLWLSDQGLHSWSTVSLGPNLRPSQPRWRRPRTCWSTLAPKAGLPNHSLRANPLRQPRSSPTFGVVCRTHRRWLTSRSSCLTAEKPERSWLPVMTACVSSSGGSLSPMAGGRGHAMSRLHGLLKRINISQLHCNGVETLTPWHPEWAEVTTMFERALQGGSA
jgi:hypothetical protein